MDRYAIALNKRPTDTLMKGKSAEEYPACHYECMNRDPGCGKRCGVESGIGWICSRSPGHEGPHVACAGSGRHERHIWYMPGKDISTGEGPYR